MKILGVMPVYNEADCIEIGLQAMQHAGCDEIQIFDHGSTDGSGDVCERLGFTVHRISRVEEPIVGTDGRFSFSFWNCVAHYILARKLEFDWVYWGDADELLRQPNGQLATKAALLRDAEHGVEVIRPLIRMFYMTKGDASEQDAKYLERMNYFKVNRVGHSPRAWRINLTPEYIPAGAHIQDPSTGEKVCDHYAYWPTGTVVSNNKWLLDIYLFRSRQQAWNKLYNDGRVALDGSPWFAHMMTADKRIKNLYHSRNSLTRESRMLDMP